MEARRHAAQAYLQQAASDRVMLAVILGRLFTSSASAAPIPNAPTLEQLEAMAADTVGPGADAHGHATLQSGGGSLLSPEDAELAAFEAKTGLTYGGMAAKPAAPAPAPVAASPSAAEKKDAEDAVPDVPTPEAAVLYYKDDVAPAGSGDDGFVAGEPRPFSLESMDAFDCLLEDGFAVVLSDGETCLESLNGKDIPADAPGPKPGQRASLAYTSLVWDGSAASASCYESVVCADFTVMDLRDDRVPHGLHLAVQRVEPGQVVTVVLAPEKAYGDIGKDPYVPKGAQIVYNLRLDSVSGAPREMGKFAQPRKLTAESKFQGAKAAAAAAAPAAAPAVTHAGGMRGMTAAGGMPTPDEAEKAFRAYLATMDNGSGGGGGGGEQKEKKSGFLKGLFKGGKR
jgi:hypothetical protein